MVIDHLIAAIVQSTVVLVANIRSWMPLLRDINTYSRKTLTSVQKMEDINLVVPVIHGADKLNISGIAHEIENLSNRARSNKLTMPEVENGNLYNYQFRTSQKYYWYSDNQSTRSCNSGGIYWKETRGIETLEGDMIAIRHKMYLFVFLRPPSDKWCCGWGIPA